MFRSETTNFKRIFINRFGNYYYNVTNIHLEIIFYAYYKIYIKTIKSYLKLFTIIWLININVQYLCNLKPIWFVSFHVFLTEVWYSLFFNAVFFSGWLRLFAAAIKLDQI
jgi:hypothetical protein